MAAASPQNESELWQLYLQGLQKLGQWAGLPWLPLNGSTTVAGAGTSAGLPTQSPLSELFDLYWNIYEKSFGSFHHTPTLGYTREFNNKLLQGWDTWINFYQASFDYQVVLVNVWLKAFEELILKLAVSEKKAETVQNWRQFLQLWSATFDQVFTETFLSENALRTRRRFLHAAMNYRLHQQQLMEVLLKMNDLPVRSEVDEVHRSIYEMRKEIKSLKKALAESQT
jgi:class III poly(R)-hydroxyalkanoic acid synthase PhaE subunit